MVHFVGAGCGAPDLVTLRGARQIADADVIIYAGSLVNPALLAGRKPGCAVHDSATLTLEQVLALIREAHAAGHTVVRLHTGDPSIYGAIAEQMRALDALDIPYDVTPGVSSFSGAAAALCAEYTLPEISQTVILTRMAGRTPVPEGQDIRALAAHRASMAIFLSAHLAAQLSAELIAGGYTADTPAAVVYKASWPGEERTLRCTVGTLPQTLADSGIRSTALILVGDFLGGQGARSKLYDPAFTTGYRKGTDA